MSTLEVKDQNVFPGFVDEINHYQKTRWWQLKYFVFLPLFGEDEPILTNMFQMGWLNHQLENDGLSFLKCQ